MQNIALCFPALTVTYLNKVEQVGIAPSSLYVSNILSTSLLSQVICPSMTGAERRSLRAAPAFTSPLALLRGAAAWPGVCPAPTPRLLPPQPALAAVASSDKYPRARMAANPPLPDLPDDAAIEKFTGISRAQHENRNSLNQLPSGKLKPKDGEKKLYIDDAGRLWRRVPDIFASFHQPFPKNLAIIRSVLSFVTFGFTKVPNLKFMGKNDDGTFAEVCVNRYSGKLIVDPALMGSHNFATDAPKALETGSLPTTGEHWLLDIVPHEQYGAKYRHIAAGFPVGSLDGKEPVVAMADDL